MSGYFEKFVRDWTSPAALQDTEIKELRDDILITVRGLDRDE